MKGVKSHVRSQWIKSSWRDFRAFNGRKRLRCAKYRSLTCKRLTMANQHYHRRIHINDPSHIRWQIVQCAVVWMAACRLPATHSCTANGRGHRSTSYTWHQSNNYQHHHVCSPLHRSSCAHICVTNKYWCRMEPTSKIQQRQEEEKKKLSTISWLDEFEIIEGSATTKIMCVSVCLCVCCVHLWA